MFDPQAFIALSCTLSGAGRSEAEYRTAISRALYGIFLWAREELHARGEYVKLADEADKPYEHSRVRQRFKQGKFRHDGVSQRLGALYKSRYRSDYDLEIVIQRSEVLQVLEYVDYIRDQFTRRLFTNPPHSS